jgi:hypothetical protein
MLWMHCLALSDRADALSGVAQIAALVLSAILGRFYFKGRLDIWVIAFLGCTIAMVANLLVDGQGACFMYVYVPIIYLVATVGRDLP